MTTTSLRGKRVLVTGAAGFIGSHLAEALVHAGAQVNALVRYSSTGARGWLDQSPVRDEIRFFHGDLRDPGLVEKAAKDCDTLFHLGALIGIPYSYDAPESYIQTNILGTLHVLKAAMAVGARRVVHTSTSEVYGTAIYSPIDEKHPLQGQSPYSASKIGADKLVESFNLSFGVETVTVRPFNTFGPRQSARAVIPTIISQIVAGKKSIHLGSLDPKRDLNYVSNTVAAFIVSAEAPGIAGETIHFGSNRTVSIGELFEIIRDLAGSDAVVECDPARVRPAKSEVGLLWADNTKAKKLLGWEPEVTLEQGLQKMIDWTRENQRHYRINEYAV